MISFSIKLPNINQDWLKHSMKEITQVIEEENRSYWSQQKSPLTERKWAPRKEPTGNWPILNKTGNLFQNTKFSPGSSPGSITASYPFYGKFHLQNRPWLGVPKTSQSKIAEIITNKIFL